MIRAIAQKTNLPNITTLSSPFLNLNTSQFMKVTAVAMASFSFLFLQLGLSFSSAASLSLITSSITWISEKWRGGISDWFNIKKINLESLSFWLPIYLIALPISVAILYGMTGLVVQAAAQQILAGNIKIIFLTTLLAPVTEEILFRGFLQERMDDLTNLASRYIYPISENRKKWIACATASLIFGAFHIRGKQVLGNLAIKIAVFANLVFKGVFLGQTKNNEGSLISPIIHHAASNTGIVMGFRLASRLF